MLSLSYQLFVKVGIVVYYELNKEYITEQYCVNKDKPEMDCCGKCYLSKQLNKADEPPTKENKSIPTKWELGESMIFIAPTPLATIPFIATEYIAYLKASNEAILSYSPLDNIFHPPGNC